MEILTDGKEVADWLDEVTSGAYAAVCEMFKDKPGAYLIGGALRDFFIRRRDRPKDFDVPVMGTTFEELSALPGARINFLGAAVLNVKGMDVDVWPLQETISIRKFGLPCTIQGLLLGTPFTLERIAMNMKTNEILDMGCMQAIKDQIIDFAPYTPYNEHIQAIRAVLIQRKTGFRYSERTNALLKQGITLLQNPVNWKEVEEFFSPRFSEDAISAREELFSLKL